MITIKANYGGVGCVSGGRKTFYTFGGREYWPLGTVRETIVRRYGPEVCGLLHHDAYGNLWFECHESVSLGRILDDLMAAVP